MEAIFVLIVITVLSLVYIIYVYFDMTYVIELQQRRISEMATMLQIAEHQTERPYYTSLCVNQTQYEYPNWLYKAKHEKLIQSMSPSEPVAHSST